MIIRELSLNKLLILLLFLSGLVQAEVCTKDFPVVERNPKGSGFSMVSKTLEDLYCDGNFEGKYFKIVHATKDKPISFEHVDKDLVKKAANVYYHLSVARNFWVTSIGSDYVKNLPQITVRLDIANAFSSVRHFKNAELEKNSNNAWSVPGGETPKGVKEQMKWGKEIWFSPSQQLESKKLVTSEGNNPVHESLVLIQDPVIEYNKNAIIYQGLSFLVTPSLNQSEVIANAAKSLGAIAILYGAIEITKHADSFFMSKYYYIDTAMVPEIIYHEYAHIAMSDTMKTVHSIPVIEGMADFFASTIAKRRHMYESLKGFSSNKGKDLNSKQFYHPYLEGEWNSTSDFSVSLLWQGRESFEKYNALRKAKGKDDLVNYDQLVFDTHKHLNEFSDIATGLNGALIESCKNLCENPRAGINLLNQLFERRGFN
jgi:hypothetical protein